MCSSGKQTRVSVDHHTCSLQLNFVIIHLVYLELHGGCVCVCVFFWLTSSALSGRGGQGQGMVVYYSTLLGDIILARPVGFLIFHMWLMVYSLNFFFLPVIWSLS